MKKPQLYSGELRHRIRIEYPVDVRNSLAELERSWELFATVWAKINDLSAKDLVAAKAVQSLTTTRITIRYLSGIQTNMRIVYRGEIYKIAGISRDMDSGIEYQTIMAERGVAEGGD